MTRRRLPQIASALLVGAALAATAAGMALSAAASPDALRRRPIAPGPPPACLNLHPTRPRRQPPCRRTPFPRPPRLQASQDKNFEIRITGVDADPAAIPAVNAALASSSNREDQLAGLRAQADRGGSPFQIAYGPTLRVLQDTTVTRESREDEGAGQSGPPAATRTRVVAHPHLNAVAEEVIDLSVEQVPAGAPWTGDGTRSSLVFEHGDTKLVGESVRPDGRRHLVYATVFFPAGYTKACARPSNPLTP